LHRGRTKSGVQRPTTRWCSRNLNPSACTARRRSTSGLVLLVRLPRRWAPFSVGVHPLSAMGSILVDQTGRNELYLFVEHFYRASAHTTKALIPRSRRSGP